MYLRNNLLLGLALFFSTTLFSKTIYIKFDPACMDRLEYRLNGNMAGNGLISYSLKAGNAKRVVMEIGVESIKQVKRMPRGTKACGQIKVDVQLANSINTGKDKVYIVRKVGENYIVSPVHLATYMKDSEKQFSLRGNQLDMAYATTDIGVMEHNLAKNNSPTKVFFIGSEKKVCSDAYLLKKIPEETCKPYTDLTFLPGLGILEEKTGLNQAEAENNVLRLVKVNNVPLEAYIATICSGNKVKYEPIPEAMVSETPTLKPATTSKPTTPVAEEPARGEVIFPIDNQPPAPEYRPAGSELVYEYDQPQAPLETFRPKGIPCNELSYQGVHIVQSGQTLYSIARQYNLTIKQLRAWNKLTNEDLINPCQSIYVLPPTTVADNVETTPTDATILYEKTAPQNTIPVTPSQNVNVAKGATTVTPDKVYTDVAKQTDILYPKSGAAPANYTSVSKKKADDSCNKLAYDGVHIVQKGETLYSISQKYDLEVKQIQQWNKLDDKNKIKPCMSLYIKTPESVIAAINQPNTTAKGNENYTIPDTDLGTSYTNAPPNSNVSEGAAAMGATDKMWNSGIEYHIVQKGETLIGLAKMYGFTVERFRDINGLGDSNIIRIGQVLRTGNCLCPANAVRPSNVSSSSNSGNSNSSTEMMISKGETLNSTKATEVERTTEYTPVPVPYDYETQAILNQSKHADGTTTYRNGRKVHTVQENETMASIATKYNIPVEVLRKLNNMDKGEIVIPDMKIYLE